MEKENNLCVCPECHGERELPINNPSFMNSKRTCLACKGMGVIIAIPEEKKQLKKEKAS